MALLRVRMYYALSPRALAVLLIGPRLGFLRSCLASTAPVSLHQHLTQPFMRIEPEGKVARQFLEGLNPLLLSRHVALAIASHEFSHLQ